MAQVKVQWFFNMTDQGWSETLYWVTVGSLDRAKLFSDINKLTGFRLNLLVDSARFKGVRATDLTPDIAAPLTPPALPHRSAIARPNTKTGFPGTLKQIQADPAIGVLCNLYDADSTVRHSLVLKGIPNTVAQFFDPDIGRDPEPGAWIRASNIWLAELGITIGPNAPPTNTVWSIRARSTNPDISVTEQILAIDTVGGSDHHWVIWVDNDNDWKIGQIAHIHHVNECSAKGLNGDTVVMKVGIPDALGTPLTVSKQKCCEGTAEHYDGTGTVYRVVRSVFYPIQSGGFQRTTSRKPGRPTITTRGRARKRCCR